MRNYFINPIEKMVSSSILPIHPKAAVVFGILLIFSLSVNAHDYWFEANKFLPKANSIGQATETGRGTERRPIIDSQMSKTQVFEGLDTACPLEIRKRQRIVKVKYLSFDGKIHHGQIVIDKELVGDIKSIFNLALKEKFPIQSVTPISHPQFRKDSRWNDDLSMAANNTSGFNYREKTGGGSLSNHAYAWAIDINTVQNPYLKANLVLPPNGKYDPQSRGTLTAESPIVKKFLELGWTWGGSWESLKDYQHFEKPLRNVATINAGRPL